MAINVKAVEIEFFKSRVLIKCRRPAKKPATSNFEPPTFQGNRGRFESESLKSLDAVEKLKVLLTLNL